VKTLSWRQAPLPWVLSLIGFTAVVAQIVLMRELIVVFHGNEISLGVVLACWLLWTAAGSGLVGRWAVRTRSPRRVVAGLQAALAFIFPLTIMAVRAGAVAFGATPGEILGPGPMFLTSFVTLSLFCVVSGALFAVGGRLVAAERVLATAEATSAVYLLEAVGSAVGGVVASVYLIRSLSAPEIALVLSTCNLISAVVLTITRSTKRAVIAAVGMAVCGLVVVPYGGRALEAVSLAYQWRGFNLVETRQSIYGNLAVTEGEGGVHTLYQNGSVLVTFPDPAAAEEAVHFALLEHPSPRSVLLIGGGVGGALAETLRHPTVEHVTYVELDPTIIRLVFQYQADRWKSLERDPRVTMVYEDGRLFLERSDNRYDVVIVNMPDPQTAQLNRVYTVEFFRRVSDHLTPGGVFSFKVTGAENYIGRELAEFLRCLNRTLREVFAQVVTIPGASIHFIAAGGEGSLTSDPAVLVERLRARRLETQYVREYYIPFRMTPDRMDDLRAQIAPVAGTPVNRDFAPVAYYFDVVLWSTRFHESYRRLFDAVARVGFGQIVSTLAVVLVIAVIVGRWRLRGRRRLRAAAGSCVAAMGFAMIGLEVLILLGFQALFGYVYHQLALLIAAFMAGMALGSWWSQHRLARNRNDDFSPRTARALLGVQVVAVVFPLVLFAAMVLASRAEGTAGVFAVGQLLFPALALMSGGLGGYQFPIASRIYFAGAPAAKSGPGAVYALDLVGACVGAIVISAYLIPLFGFLDTVALLAVVNAAPAVAVAVSIPAAAGRS
jgi:spermidine synthase